MDNQIYLIDRDTLTDIAKAIREKKGTNELISTENFASEIKSIEQSLDDRVLSRVLDHTLTELVVPENATMIARYVFFQAALEKVTFHEKLTTIESYAFGNCKLSGTLILPDSLTTIGENAFRYNSKISKVVFGTNIQSIGSAAFDNCTGCREYDFTKSVVVPTLGINVFRAIPTGSKIIVPEKKHFEWVNATNWSSCRANITAIVSIPIDQLTGETIVYLNSVWVYGDMSITGSLGSNPKAYYKFENGERVEFSNENPAFGVWGFEYTEPDEGGWNDCRITNIGGDFTYFTPCKIEFWIEDSYEKKLYSRILEVTE